MISLEIIRYSIKNLWNRKFRSFLTIFSIFVGIATIFVFLSFGWGLFDYTNELTSSSSVDKILIQAKGNSAAGLDDTFKLTDDDVETVESVSGVESATGVYFKVAEIKNNDERIYGFLVGYDPEKPLMLEVFNIGVEEGRILEADDDGRVVLGYNYLVPGKIFDQGLQVNDKIEVQGVDLRVIGFLEEVGNPSDDSQIYVISDSIEEIYPEENNSFSMIVAKVDVDQIDIVVDRIERDLRKSRGFEQGKEDFFVQSFDDLIESFSNVLNIIIGFIILIALISIVVSSVNTANTMITSVIERIKEIGVMKSIGAKNSEIFNIFLLESSILGFIAGVLGVLMGFVISYSIALLLDSLGWGFLKPHISFEIFLGLILFATFTGAISGAWPAWQASKVKPVDALRYE